MLFLYLAVSEHSVSIVLVREDDRKQSPIYYVSKALLNAESQYSQLEKLALALVTATRKLRSYFQSHPITVLTSFPLKNILHKPELSGWLTKWAVELSEHHINYQPRTAIKSQVLADFIAEFSPNSLLQAEKELMTMKEGPNEKGTWTLHVNGSSNFKGSGLRLVLTSPNGDKIEQSIRSGF
ncbi:hypothetical protein UlMin_040048 [Ulmus minor]